LASTEPETGQGDSAGRQAGDSLLHVHFANAPAPRSAKGRNTVRSLMDGAVEVFARDGYVKARVSDISAAAGLSNGAFYRYFTDKRHVMLNVLGEFLEKSDEYVATSFQPEDPTRSVRVSTERYFAFYAEHAALHQLLIQVGQADPEVEELRISAAEAWYRRMARMLKRADDLGLVKPGVDVELWGVLIGGLAENYAYLAFVQKRDVPTDPKVVADQVTLIWASTVFK
jgi:AcrR family transcriptional regulator